MNDVSASEPLPINKNAKPTDAKEGFARNVVKNMSLARWKPTISPHGTRAERLFQRIAKCFASEIIA